jgi:arylsulfatase A-like enzyme
MGRILGGAARGLVAGVAAGVVWWTIEATLDRALGGLAPRDTAAVVAALDVAVGAIAGLALGALLRDPAALVLGLAAVFAFLRVYEPPGFLGEAAFVVAAAFATVLARAAAGREPRRPLFLAHLTLLGAGAIALGELVLDTQHEGAVSGPALVGLLAALPVAGVLADRALGVAVRRRGLRLGLELASAGVALLLFGQPLASAPLDDPIVTAVPPPAGTPDVILVTLDTTRADHLSTYGYARETSPHLTAFAGDALRFDQARSPAAWTLPGHASLFTGMYPSRHGAHLAGGFLGGRSIDGHQRVAYPLPEDRVTLAEALRDRGYRTAGFAANFSYLYRAFGVAQGFGHWDDAPGLLFRVRPNVVHFAQQFAPGFCLKPFRGADEVNREAFAWLDGAAADRPVFLFVNYMEAHEPWLAAPPYDRWARGLPDASRLARKNLYTHTMRTFTDAEQAFIVANYDGELVKLDEALGALLAGLHARGRYENALVIVTSDHGESLGEHGQVGHIGRMLYEPLLHVPLVVKFPGAERPRGRVADPVQLVDVLPTVLEAAGAPIPAGVQGEPLLHVTHPSVAEEDINPWLVAHYGPAYDRATRVLYDGSYKLITTSHGERMLFDLARDPAEADDLAARDPDRVDALARRLDTAMGDMQVVAAGRN